jgi:hypothetical protein
MPDHLIDVDDIVDVEWNTFCKPAVRVTLGSGNWSIIARESAICLAQMGVIESDTGTPIHRVF